MLNIGIVGLGHIAQHQIAAIQLSDQFRLVAGCDTDPASLSLLGAEVDAYTDLEFMLERSDLDAVIVATPNKLHVEHGIAVMQAAKWLVMEKPVAESQALFDELLEARKKFAGRCTVALHAAHGREVEWFCAQLHEGAFDQYQFSLFHSEFYDPYINDGKLEQGASSLGGSWMDSGINALSVISRFVNPENLSITNSLMTRSGELHCLETKGTVDFKVSDPFLAGIGSIDTNWTLGLNKKATVLGIADGGERSNQKITLDHSEQAVILSDHVREEILFSCDNGLPRLTNHYIGVFEDLAKQIRAGQDNINYAQRLHTILYRAENWRE